MAFILGIILLMIINYYHNVPIVGFMMTVMITDMMLVIGNMMAKKHCDDDSDRDCTFPSFSTSSWDKHWWNAPRNGIAGVCRFVQIYTPIFFSFIVIRTQLLESHFCHPISVDPLGHRPKWHLRVPVWSNPVPEISSCRNSSEVMVIKRQKDGFWGVTFLDKSQIFGDPVKVFNISILSVEPTLTTSCQDWITVNYFALHGCRFH